MSKRSRLNRNLEKESKKNFVLSILGIILVLFLAVKFGIPLMANLALVMSNSKDTNSQVRAGPDFISAPVLDMLPNATNSASLKVTGKANANSDISLYLNGELIDKTQAGKDGGFLFNLTLNKGDNKIYAKSKINNKSSESSDELNVAFKSDPPALSIDSPTDGQKFNGDQNFLKISGSTDPQAKVTVNGFWSIVDQNNKFAYQLPLQNGDNEIKIVAQDIAGNRTEKTIKVNYSH